MNYWRTDRQPNREAGTHKQTQRRMTKLKGEPKTRLLCTRWKGRRDAEKNAATKKCPMALIISPFQFDVRYFVLYIKGQ